MMPFVTYYPGSVYSVDGPVPNTDDYLETGKSKEHFISLKF